MNKEELTKLGLTEEQGTEVLKLLQKSYTHNDVYKSEKQKIEKEYNQKLADAVSSHQKEMNKLKINSEIDLALTVAKSRNNKAVKALLSEFLERAELDENQSVKGLNDEIKKLKESKDSNFLFVQENQQEKPKGYELGQSSEDFIKNANPFAKATFNLTEQGKIFKEDPLKFKNLEKFANN